MYKWPQGRVIRIVCLIVILMVVADLGYGGAYAQFAATGTGSYGRQTVLGSIFSAFALAALISGLVAVGFHHRAVDFLIEVEEEMTKVEWPTMSNLVRSTLIIFVAVAIMGALIFGVDVINFNFINHWWPALYNWASEHLFSK